MTKTENVVTTSSGVSSGRNLISETIDWLRFPMTILVVFVHADSANSEPEHLTVWHNGLLDVVTVLFSQCFGRIAVPVFFFISGYLFFKGLSVWDNKVWLAKEKKRVKSLLVPYLLWNIIALIAYVLFWMVKAHLEGTAASPMDLLIKRGYLRIFWDNNIPHAENFINILGVNMSNVFPIDGPLWFLRDLMILTCMSPVIWLLVKYGRWLSVVLFGVLTVFGIGFPFNGNLTLAFFYFLFGAYFMICEKDFLEIFKRITPVAISVLSISLIIALFSYNTTTGIDYSRIFVNLVAVSGLVVSFSVASSLLRKGKTKVNMKLAKRSFFLYVSQSIYFVSLASFILKCLIPGTGAIIMTVKYFLLVGLTVVMLLGLYSLMKKFLPHITDVLMGSRG